MKRTVIAGMLVALTLGAIPFAHAASTHYSFDLGTDTSPVKEGWTRVTHQTVYSATHRWGWEHAAAGSFNDSEPVAPQFRSTHPNFAGPLDDPVLRDGVEDEHPLTFIVDVPPGKYWVSVTLGRYRAFRHDMNVRLNGSLIATNVDAWGYVWGSQGGTPTKTIAAVAEARDGPLRLEFDYAPPTEDRWKEYSSKRPQGGKLWYLGPNKNSIVGIRVRPFQPPLLQLAGQSITGTVHAASLRHALAEFNNGRSTAALAAATNFVPANVDEIIEQASFLECLAGSMAIEDRTHELALAREAAALWSQVIEQLPASERNASARFWLATARCETTQRYVQALEYVAMLGFKWADQKTGLNKYHRYWAAYDLCGPFTPDDPLYFKSHLLRGRVSLWNGHEGGWKNCYDLARQHFDVLRAPFPGHRIVRMYSGERVPTRDRFQPAADRAPEWARLQYEALHRYLALIHYWVEQRQSENGELGGGWGDDVEILRGWLPAVLGLDDPVARRGLQKLAEGVWRSGELTNGYSRGVDDVEHAAELMSDTQPLMCLVEYGDPVYLERCMETMRCMRDVWTGVTTRGHRHFKSHYFSATVVNTNVPRTADVALNARAVNPGIPLLWFNDHPAVRKLLGDWCRAWIEDSFRTNNGKPLGFVPGSIRFDDERFGGFAEQWWKTRDYFSDFESVGYTQTLYDTMLALFAVTHDDFYLTNILATVEAVADEVITPSAQAPDGSSAWAARICDSESVAEVIAKWRQTTGHTTHDTFLKRRGSPYVRYLVTGDRALLNDALRKIIQGLSENIEMSTSEVLFTDRVNLPGNEVLFEMITGSVGAPTYYPLHAVTWEATSNQVAILVTAASARGLDVQLFNFGSSAMPIRARPWRLEPGEYKLVVQPDGAPAETNRAVASRAVRIRERGERLQITLPPHQLVQLRLTQTHALPTNTSARPDLALGSDAIEVLNPPLRPGKPARLRLILHNIGTASANASAGELRVAGVKAGDVYWPALDAPLDLKARHVAAEVEWTPQQTGQHVVHVIADIGDRVRELAEINNQREIVLHVK